jgi:hypothetical protein
MAKKYAWGDGKGRVHSRPKRTPAQLRKAVRQKAVRRADARLDKDPLYDPAQQLSGARLSHAAQALTDLEFNPQRKALTTEATQAERQGGALQSRAGGYFLQLAEAERGNVERSQAVGNLLQQRLGTIGQESTQALDAAQQKSQDVLNSDETLRGPGLQGGSTQLAEELAAARARQASSQQAATTEAAASTADYGNLADLSRRAREVRGGETVQQLANAESAQLGDIASRRAALEASVGPKRTENLLNLRQSGFENAATAAGLDIDQAKIRQQMRSDAQDAALARAKLRATNKQNKARNRLTRAQIRATRRGQTLSAATQRRGQTIQERTQIRSQNMTAAQRAADRASRERIAKARRKGTKVEPADARKIKTSISNALADITSGVPLKIDKKTYSNPAAWLRDQGAPGIVIKAAMERRHGGLRLETVSELRRLGVRVPKGWIGAYKGPIAP